MFQIDINPNLLHLGPFLLAWHGIFSAVGIYLGVWVAGKLLSRDGETNIDTFYAVAMWAVAGGIIGARALYVIEHGDVFLRAPLEALKINEGGISIFGGFIGGSLLGALMAWRKGISLGKFADAASAGMALGQAIGRIGDVINGEHHGAHWNGPLSVVYTNANTLGERGVPVHLAVGYEMILDALLFYALYRFYGRYRRPGMGFWFFFAGYSFIRFAVGFFRLDSIVARPFGVELGQAQLLGLWALPVAAVALIYLARTAPRKQPDPPAVRVPADAA